MNGLLIVDKSVGFTSRDIVNIISKIVGTKKVGHTGTLDPLATGVLVITIGRYTKLGELLTGLDKEYIAEVKLGIETDTLDITGNILKEENVKISLEEVKKTLESFKGIYNMEVPIYSAKKVNGKKLYEYARNNLSVKLPVKDVLIKDIELLNFNKDIFLFQTKVEKGTYIRSLIKDICKSMNVIGTMSSLRRIRQGNFTIDEAYKIEDIKNGNFKVLKLQDVLMINSYELTLDEYLKVKNGNSLKLDLKDDLILLMYNKEEIAIYKKSYDSYRCYVMLKIEA